MDLRKTAILLIFLSLIPILRADTSDNWLVGARVVSVYVESEDEIPDMGRLRDQGVSVIELDVDLNYDTSIYGDRSDKLSLIKEVVRRAHSHNIKVLVYVPSLEVISDHVLEWVQLSLDGRPVAVYWNESDFFWLEPGEVSNWMSPLSPHREKIKELLSDIQATGADGIWLDVPHMPSWLSEEKSDLWPDASKWGAEDFRKRYGHDPPQDTESPYFRDWMEWRHQVVADFLKELSSQLRIPIIVESSATDWGNELAFEPSVYGGLQAPEVGPPDCENGFKNASFDDWSAFVAQLKYVRFSSEIMIPLTYGADPTDSGRQLGIIITMADGYFETNADCYMTGTVGEGYRKKAFTLVRALSGPKKSTARVAVVFSHRLRDRLDTYVYGPYDMTDTKYMASYRKLVEELLREGVQFDIIPEGFPTDDYELVLSPTPDGEYPRVKLSTKSEEGGLIHLNFSLGGCVIDVWDNVLGLRGERYFGLVFSFDKWSLMNATKYPETFYLSFSNLSDATYSSGPAIYVVPSPVDRAGLSNSSLATNLIFVGGPAVNWWPYNPFKVNGNYRLDVGGSIFGKMDHAVILVKRCGGFNFVWAGGLTRYGTRAALLWLSSGRKAGPITYLEWRDLNGNGSVELKEVREVKA